MNQRQIDILEIFTEASVYGIIDIPRKQIVRLPAKQVTKKIKAVPIKYKTIRPIPYRLTQKGLDY